MILSDYICEHCEYKFEDIREFSERKFSLCPKCSGYAKQLLSLRSHYKDFVSGWWRDISYKPVYISSKHELREVCERNNCYAKIDDGVNKRGTL